MGCKSCMANSVIMTCATIYLILGIVVMAAAGATFFTEYGKIIPPLYAGAMMGGGAVLVFLATLGYCAGCKSRDEDTGRQTGRVYLFFFTLLTFIMFVLTIAGIAYMFAYENILHTAANANVDINAVENAVGDFGTTTLKTLATSTFVACDANVTMATASTFAFTCENSGFSLLEATINTACLPSINTPFSSTENSTALFADCYSEDLFNLALWPAPLAVPGHSMLSVLNTPKGIFCACSSEILDNYILAYMGYAKWVLIGIALFFFAVFFACCHQFYKRGGCFCCWKPTPKADPNGVQLSYGARGIDPNANAPGGKSKKGAKSDMFLARP